MSDARKRAAEDDASQVADLPNEKRPKTESTASAQQNTIITSEEKIREGRKTGTESENIAAATIEQKENWKGWCEIDSDPAIFNVMLREFGVKGAKIQEVIGLDDELLAWVNKPIYGLIFLFRYNSEIPYKGNSSCPEHIWFANQTTDNLCASVAILNIVNNVPGLELGENLANFKTFTQPLTPPLRGYALSQNFEFVRRIHNSFARKQDMINVDRALARQASKRRSAARTMDADDDSAELAYHFIAFVPVEDEVWMLDGMDRQPTMVGPAGTDWIDQAKPKIIERMELYQETEVNFALLAVVQDPLIRLGNQLAENIKLVRGMRSHMDAISQDWREFLSAEEAAAEEGCLYGPNEAFQISERMISDARFDGLEKMISSSDLGKLARLWKERVAEQAQLRAQIRSEQQQEYEDADAAEKRRFDHSPAIRTWLGYLASKPGFEGILQQYEG